MSIPPDSLANILWFTLVLSLVYWLLRRRNVPHWLCLLATIMAGIALWVCGSMSLSFLADS